LVALPGEEYYAGMKWRAWLDEWGMSSLKIKSPFLEMEWKPQGPDRQAAWELYVELLTRVTTQPLPDQDGDEQAALTSVFNLFGLTRDILRRNFRCVEFSKIAVVVLNQVIRPFTAKWHKLSLQGAFKDPALCKQFRKELVGLQETLAIYSGMLSQMAGLEEDLTHIDATP